MNISAITSASLAALWLVALPMQATAQTGGSNASGTTFLRCDDRMTAWQDITIDFARSTVNNRPATINPTVIDWTDRSEPDETGTVYVVNTFHLDRTTGTLRHTTTYYYTDGRLFPGNNNPNTSNYRCTVASAPVTKF